MDNKLTAISLFTGAGGMDIGFETAGFNVVFANELMKEAAETYRANHPGCNMVNDDINNVFDELSNYAGVDLVFGGPPCQGFSVAGKMDPDDERSKLIFTFLDVIEKVRPRIFVMENVKALGILDKWEPVRKKYMDRAFSLGYNCASFILNATEYGVSQKRERVFFIGFKDNNDPFFEYHMNDFIERQKNPAANNQRIVSSRLERLAQKTIQIHVQPKSLLQLVQLCESLHMLACILMVRVGQCVLMDILIHYLLRWGEIKRLLLMKNIFMVMLPKIGLLHITRV